MRPVLLNRWHKMHDRCYNERHVAFDRYGGRGIKVCKRWHDFENFFSDMSESFSFELTLDRVDNDKGYSPSNCRWATSYEQSRNKSSNLILTHNGLALALTDWANVTGINKQTLSERLKRGWSVSKTLETPITQRHWSKAKRLLAA